MTVTWKDYRGPNLTDSSRPPDLDPLTCGCSRCLAEVAARKAWAVEENRKPISLQQGAGNPSVVRQFATGANRDVDTGKLDFEGFLSPLVLEAFATYMNFNRHLADGSVRASDNWQKGIPLDVYAKSAWRHFFDFWKGHRDLPTKEGILWGLLGLLFNVQGYVHELLKKDPDALARALAQAEDRRQAALVGVPTTRAASASALSSSKA